MSEKVELAAKYFSQGYNCCQAVVKAMATEENEDLLVKIAMSFGGGVGGQNQVCGCVTAMAIILGEKYGCETPEKGDTKATQRKMVSDAMDEFKAVTGSVVCGELLGLPNFMTVENRNKLPCNKLVELATSIIENK